MTSAWDVAIAEALERLEAQSLLRSPRPLRRQGARAISPQGQELLNFSSNDYLGLSSHPALVEAACRAARERGCGSTASRLIVGDDPAYAELEKRVAAHKGTEDALIVGSGFLANLGTIAALAGRDDEIFSDALNHASIIDGCRLSRAAVTVYRHCDVDHLQALLRRSRARRKLIVTETVFSMDGDTAPLCELVELKERYGAAILVDEAHAAGVFGPRGEGYAHELGLAEAIDLHMGTFSKAFGVYGAYLAGRAQWIRYLRTSCRTFIYTTALPPPVIGAVGAALDLVRTADSARRELRRKAARFRAALRQRGLDTGGSTTQIVPLIVGETDAALSLSRSLEEAGILAFAIRPPTVPPGTARLRFSLSAAHSDHDLDLALAAIGSAAGLARVGDKTPA
ncbi:MAG: 8-amino-7-oxononanoate synthase [Thermoleophilia bacterium]